jgi:hypothetical protein
MATQRLPDIESLAHAAARAERLSALAAEVARRTAGGVELCDPIEAAWLSEHVAGTDRHLFALRWFNPLGPTHLEFVLKAVPGRDAALLVANQRHPFSPEAWALGLLAPKQRDSADRLVAVFLELARWEHGKVSALVSSTPTLALLPKGGPLGWNAFRQIVRVLLTQVDGRKLEQAIAYMRQFPARPWDRTAAELEDTFARFAPHLETETPPPARPRHAPITDELFDAWWACVTDPAHAEAEMTEFPNAWDGAVRFQRGEFLRKASVQSGHKPVRGPGDSDNLTNDEEVV